jgi:hypothetical protein
MDAMTGQVDRRSKCRTAARLQSVTKKSPAAGAGQFSGSPI